MNKNRKSVAVLFGGKSPEHEVSIITGLQIINNIDKEKFRAIPIYISKNGAWYTGKNLEQIETYKNISSISNQSQINGISPAPNYKIIKHSNKGFFPLLKSSIETLDVVIPCFHGGLGENGGIQGLFELAEIPYVGSGILGSSLGMDKIVMKNIFNSSDIPTSKFYNFYRNDFTQNRESILNFTEQKLKYPMIVKPSSSGSSIGIAKASNRAQLINSIEVAALFDRKIIIEEQFEHTKEINISVIGNSGSELITSACEEVLTNNDFLTYEDKYLNGNNKSQGMASAKRKIPANIPKKLEVEIQETAKKVFTALDCFGIARIDFLLNEKTNNFIVLEINTLPGSFSFYLWEASNLKFKDMITKLIELSILRYKDNKRNINTFPTNILENFEGSAKSGKFG